MTTYPRKADHKRGRAGFFARLIVLGVTALGVYSCSKENPILQNTPVVEQSYTEYKGLEGEV